MSRGIGPVQQYLVSIIGQGALTFADIRRIAWGEACLRGPIGAERSLRRALHGLVDKGVLLTLGDGRKGNPYRYCFSPFVVAMSPGTTTEDYRAAVARVLALPGGVEALNRAGHKIVARVPNNTIEPS